MYFDHLILSIAQKCVKNHDTFSNVRVGPPFIRFLIKSLPSLLANTSIHDFSTLEKMSKISAVSPPESLLIVIRKHVHVFYKYIFLWNYECFFEPRNESGYSLGTHTYSLLWQLDPRLITAFLIVRRFWSSFPISFRSQSSFRPRGYCEDSNTPFKPS